MPGFDAADPLALPWPHRPLPSDTSLWAILCEEFGENTFFALSYALESSPHVLKMAGGYLTKRGVSLPDNPTAYDILDAAAKLGLTLNWLMMDVAKAVTAEAEAVKANDDPNFDRHQMATFHATTTLRSLLYLLTRPAAPLDIVQDFPEDVTAQLGQELSIKLICSGNPLPRLTWYFAPAKGDGSYRPLHENADCNGDEVLFKNVGPGDEGSYKVRVTPSVPVAGWNNGLKLLHSREFRLKVDKDSLVLRQPLEKDYTVAFGDKLELAVNVATIGSRPLTFVWTKDGESVRNDEDAGAKLEVVAMRPTDAGVYTCTVTNYVNSVSTTAKVKMSTPTVEVRAPLT